MVALNIDGWKQNGRVEKMMDEYRCMFCVSKLSRLFWKFAPFYFKLLRRLGFNCLIYGVINSYVLGCWPLNRQYNSCNSIKLILLCSKHSIHNQTDLHLIFLVCLGESFHCFCFAEARTWQFHKMEQENGLTPEGNHLTTDNGLPDYFVCISYVENCMKPMV